MIRIYGASDDLLEIDGDWSEELNPSNDEENFLACSDGTLLSVEYDSDGCWRLTRIATGTAPCHKVDADGSDADERKDGTPGYSDVVTLNGPIEWVALGKKSDIARRPKRRPSATARI